MRGVLAMTSGDRYLIGKPGRRFVVIHSPSDRRWHLNRKRLVLGSWWIWWTL